MPPLRADKPVSDQHDSPPARDEDRNVGRFLHASAVQIEAATEETQGEIDGLAQLVLALAGHASNMSRRLEELAAADVDVGTLSAMREEISSLDAAANKTIARLQFADRLHQRLSNVKGNLDALADLLGESPMSRKRWDNFLEQSRAAFTMESERVLFDQILDTSPTGESANESLGDNIALFAPRTGGSDAG